MIDQNKLDALFVKAKSAPHTSVFNETKEQFLIASDDMVDKMTSKKKKFKPLNTGFIMLGIAGIIALTCVLMSSDIDESTTPNTAEINVRVEKEPMEEKTPIEKGVPLLNSPKKENKVFEVKQVLNSIEEPIRIEESISEPIQIEEPSLDSIKELEEVVKKNDYDDYVFPELTKDEVSDNDKRKKKMLKALNKKDKKVYSYIPSGSFMYKSKPISVQAFHIQRWEVTNLEYKTFLFDLLIQDRKADFLVAKPKQELWTEALGDTYRFMQNEYFSGEDYEDHPVNNISRAGAEMYCDWITREANKINKEGGKTLINAVRIPYRAEWVKAATVEGKFPEYTWEDSTSSACFYGNFSMKNYERPVLIHAKTKKEFVLGDSSAITSRGCLHGKNEILCKSKFYNENEYGLYNMCGNLAEMVYESTGSSDLLEKPNQLKSGTAGGGWMNTIDEIKLNAEDLYQGMEKEHVNIGFRVVITHFAGPDN